MPRRSWRRFSHCEKIEIVRDSLLGIADELEDLAVGAGVDAYEAQRLKYARGLAVDAATELEGVGE